MSSARAAFLVLLLCPSVLTAASLDVEAEGVALRGAPLHLKIRIAELARARRLQVLFFVDEKLVERRGLAAGEHSVSLEDLELERGKHSVMVRSGSLRAETVVRVLPGWLSLLPPLVAIGLALVFKDVIVSLLLGVFGGALFLFGWNPVTAFARSIDHFVVPALADPGNASIIIFSTLLGGMVGVITKSGGTQGIVERLKPYATSGRRGQVATWLMGLLIFFDDYANTLIVGSTMRPITDRLRISREKLAYIVDSTSAPIASVFPISTWIGFEVGLIAEAFRQLRLDADPYATFVASIPYRFYPILALVLGLTIAVSRRDFGPMARAERRSRETGKVLDDGQTPLADYASSGLAPPAEKPKRAINALLPILTVISLTLVGLYATGSAAVDRTEGMGTWAWLKEVFSNAESSPALLWASLSGVLVAMALAVVQRILTLRQATGAMINGFKSMLIAIVVLLLAWSLGAVCGELHTADYVVQLTKGVISPQFLPFLTFAVSAAISFATGTSWGTMGILMPLIIPIANSLGTEAGYVAGSDVYQVLMLGTISSVLAGSVWGDHCSPISDTTILSSMACGCDHIAHVRTQIPYAVIAGCIGMLLGDIPTAFGLAPWVSLLLGSLALVALVRWLGRESDPAWSPK